MNSRLFSRTVFFWITISHVWNCTHSPSFCLSVIPIQNGNGEFICVLTDSSSPIKINTLRITYLNTKCARWKSPIHFCILLSKVVHIANKNMCCSILQLKVVVNAKCESCCPFHHYCLVSNSSQSWELASDLFIVRLQIAAWSTVNKKRDRKLRRGVKMKWATRFTAGLSSSITIISGFKKFATQIATISFGIIKGECVFCIQ